MKIHSSPFSEFQFEPDRRTLHMVWNKDSQKLAEDEVKSEMNRVLSFIEQYEVLNIIVDSRNYVFKDNLNIQTWINQNYMPQIVDSGILKYAIIVNSKVAPQEDSGEVEKILPEVEYFNEYDEAQRWI